MKSLKNIGWLAGSLAWIYAAWLIDGTEGMWAAVTGISAAWAVVWSVMIGDSNRYRRWRCRRKGHGEIRIIEEYNAVTLSDFEVVSTGLRTVHQLIACKFHCPRCGATEIGNIGRVELWQRRTDSFSSNQTDE